MDCPHAMPSTPVSVTMSLELIRIHSSVLVGALLEVEDMVASACELLALDGGDGGHASSGNKDVLSLQGSNQAIAATKSSTG